MNDKKVHEIKLQQQFCDDVYCGVKAFEIRKNDRDYKVGDVIRFVPIDENGYKVTHSIADRSYEITYLLTNWGLEDGYIAFGIKREERKCIKCGCTENNACLDGCYWVEYDLCSSCYFNKKGEIKKWHMKI